MLRTRAHILNPKGCCRSWLITTYWHWRYRLSAPAVPLSALRSLNSTRCVLQVRGPLFLQREFPWQDRYYFLGGHPVPTPVLVFCWMATYWCAAAVHFPAITKEIVKQTFLIKHNVLISTVFYQFLEVRMQEVNTKLPDVAWLQTDSELLFFLLLRSTWTKHSFSWIWIWIGWWIGVPVDLGSRLCILYDQIDRECRHFRHDRGYCFSDWPELKTTTASRANDNPYEINITIGDSA